jgi:hypothetical protein
VEVDREVLLQNCFENSVAIRCRSVVAILAVLDPPHAEDYRTFPGVFESFEGRKKELRFLQSKLGNLSFDADDGELRKWL